MSRSQSMQTHHYPPGTIPLPKGRSRRLPSILLLGKDITLEPELARGGEGVVHRIKGSAHHVAKIFHQPSDEKTAKLLAMLEHVPHDPTYERYRHISIAWPTGLIAREQDRLLICVGFTMPYIDHQHSYPLLKLYNPEDRESMKLSFTWKYLLYMVRNLASILDELHRKGYVVSDLNESNILVSKNAMVTLVDCDSLQVPNPRTGESFRCVVGKAEYTAPELQGQDFRVVDRTPNHDNFALAVLIFLMLMEGWHPFAAVWNGEGMAPSIAMNIHDGIFPYAGKWEARHPAFALSLNILPPHIQKLMRRCFITAHDPNRGPRPSAQEWLNALEKAGGQLVQCPKNLSHVYSKHLKENCPWCERKKLGIPDPFPPPKNSTLSQPLPTPTFGEHLSLLARKIARNRLAVPASILMIMYGIMFLFLQNNHWFTHVSGGPLLVVFLLISTLFVFVLLNRLFPLFLSFLQFLKRMLIYIILLASIYTVELVFLQEKNWFAHSQSQGLILLAFFILPLLIAGVVYLLRHNDEA